MAAFLNFVIKTKNTFICAVEAEAPSPVEGRRRARTDQPRGSSIADWEKLLTDEASANPENIGDGADDEADFTMEEALAHAGILAFDPEGSKLVLQTLELADDALLRSTAVSLHPQVIDMARCPNAHRVLVRLIRLVGADEVVALAAALAGQGRGLAVDAYGSSVLCTLLDSAARSSPVVTGLVDEAMTLDVASLCYHKNGHKVIEALLIAGHPRHQHRILSTLCAEAQRACRHRVASGVVITVLTRCSYDVAAGLAEAIMGAPGAVKTLACHCFGVNVVRAMLDVPGIRDQTLMYVEKSRTRLVRDKFGVQLLKDMELHPQASSNMGIRGGA